VAGWENLPLTQAAQAVQRSAFPDAYAKWENDAQQVVAAVGSSGSWAMAIDLEHCPSNCPTILSNSGGPTPATPVATLQATVNGDGGCTAGLGGTGAGGNLVDRLERWTGALPVQRRSSHLVPGVGCEQAGDGGTHHRTIPYPYFGGYQMKPYRR
jgi:hypothetical protein